MSTTSEDIKTIIAGETASVPSIVWNKAVDNYIIDFEKENSPTKSEFDAIKLALAGKGKVLDNSFGKIFSLVVRVPSSI